MKLGPASAIAFVVLMGSAAAQQVENSAPSAQIVAPTIERMGAPTQGFVRVPAGTVIEVEVTDPLSSRTSKQGDLFGIRLAAPIIFNGQEVVAAGAVGGGEVIDAVPSGFGGRPGRLIVSARHLELNGIRTRIRGMQLTAAGENNGNAALAVGIAIGLPGMLVQGGNTEIPIGVHGTARLANDVDVPITPPAPLVGDGAEQPPQINGGQQQQ